jgi:IclR family transcriptional regulator, pca regulon regulatory protein
VGQVVDRVGALLGSFTPQEPRLSLGVCAERAGLSKSSAHRLLVSLSDIGLVERDEAGSWQIGELPLHLAAIRLSHRNMRREAQSALAALGEKYAASTAFSVPNGNQMVYVERTDSALPYEPSARLGSTAPVWAGAAGRAVLSRLPPDERTRRCQSPEWSALARSIRTRIDKELEEAATRGYSVDRGEFFDGVAGVAACLERGGVPVAAMSLIMSPERMSTDLEHQMGEELRELALEIMRRTTLPTSD